MSSYMSNAGIDRVQASAGTLRNLGGIFQSMFTDTFPGTIAQMREAARVDAEAKAAKAGDTVQSQYGNLWQQIQRDASRMGVNPNSARFQSLRQNWARAAAAAKSGAMTDAAEKAQDTSFARQSEVARLAGSVGSQALSAYQGAGSLEGSAMGAIQSLNALRYDVDRNRQEGDGYRAGMGSAGTAPSVTINPNAQRPTSPAQPAYARPAWKGNWDGNAAKMA